MKEVTPEECYACWHREYNLYNGKYVRPIKNFEKAKSKNYWKHFVRFAMLVNRNDGNINHQVYIKALVDQYEGYFPPEHLNTRRSLKIYRSYIKEKQKSTSNNCICNGILDSLDFILSFCVEHDIKTFNEYLQHNMYLIPSILKHLHSGSITKYFLACIPDFDEMLNSYPKDMVDEYATDIKDNYSLYRTKILHINEDTLKNIINNHEHLFNKLIKKRKIKKDK